MRRLLEGATNFVVDANSESNKNRWMDDNTNNSMDANNSTLGNMRKILVKSY